MSLRPTRFHWLVATVVLATVAAAAGCRTSREVRVHNVSTVRYTDVWVGDQHFGDLEPGETTEYREVGMRFRYAVLRMTVQGGSVTGQTLNLGARRLAAGSRTGRSGKGRSSC